ncbi:hypothetical protein JOD20_002467 [Herpetosiphon giganteus]|nr:hypothetical protein [Herpetosiphon giganteus]
MPQPKYHVPEIPKQSRLGVIILAILDILNTGFFGLVYFSIIVGACGVDREAVCRGMLALALVISGIFSIILLVIGFILIKQTSILLRWITLVLPCLTVLSFIILWFIWS